MKPIILKADADGNIKMSVDEIEKMIDDAYNAGYMDGRNSKPDVITPTWPTYPTWDITPHLTCQENKNSC